MRINSRRAQTAIYRVITKDSSKNARVATFFIGIYAIFSIDKANGYRLPIGFHTYGLHSGEQLA